MGLLRDGKRLERPRNEHLFSRDAKHREIFSAEDVAKDYDF